MTREKSSGNVRQKREPARLASKLDSSLLTYAMAATAAGVGMMTATQAEAEVVATPANISVPLNGGVVQFDINRDGQMDFGLSWRSDFGPGHHRKTCVSSCGEPYSYTIKALPAQAANEVWQTGSKGGSVGGFTYCAADLAAGRKVGPAAAFKAGNKVMAWLYQFFDGTFRECPWGEKSLTDHYLGVKFLDTGGNVHYGWVRILLGSPITITGYAYETTPTKSIVTGVTHGPVGDARVIEPADDLAPGSHDTASLGMLALGAPGLAVWRRPEEEQPVA